MAAMLVVPRTLISGSVFGSDPIRLLSTMANDGSSVRRLRSTLVFPTIFRSLLVYVLDEPVKLSLFLV